MSDEIKDECGIVGVFGHPEASTIAYLGLYALQHRGQDSAGIVTIDDEGKSYDIKRMGEVSEIFSEKKLSYLTGTKAIGHVRYSTTGSSNLENAQPLKVDYINGALSIAHNGNLVNAYELKNILEQHGSIFTSTCDSEILIHMLAFYNKIDFVEAVKKSLEQMKGAFSVVILNKDYLIAARDPNGFRPLAIGQFADGQFMVASETCAFDLVGAKYYGEVEAGEVVIFSKSGIHREKFAEKGRSAKCIFEYIYFARPDSYIFGESVFKIRREMGRQLGREAPVEADLVIAVPDSGVCAAIGYAEATGIKYDTGFIRNHYIGRTFIEPTQNIRDFGVKIKLNPIKDMLEGKRVVIVDDSVVRGTTSRKIIKMVRNCGAKEIHYRISSPPIVAPCFYGMDFPTRAELIAYDHSMEEIKKYLRVESVQYLSPEGLIKASGGKKENYCMACFDNDYPVDLKDQQTKFKFEC